MPTILVALGALFLVSAAQGQAATFLTFGRSCGFPGSPVPSLGATGVPQLGTVFTVTYRGPNAIEPGLGLTDQPLLMIGVVRVDLPFPLINPVQPTGCTLYPSPDVIVVPPPDAGGRAFVAQVAFSIPNDPGLIGGSLFLQWAVPHTQCYFIGCGLGWVSFSEGGEAILGT